MAVKPFRPFHRIEFRRESGSPSDPDSVVTEAVIGSAFADRRDMRAQETGAQGTHYFKTQTVYTVAAQVIASFAQTDERLATLGEEPLGSDPLGLPADAGKAVMGSAPQPDWIVFDKSRGKRYRVTGVVQSDDLKKYRMFTEEVR